MGGFLKGDDGKEDVNYCLGFRVWGFPKIRVPFWGSP